jgi:hypothetical protein
MADKTIYVDFDPLSGVTCARVSTQESKKVEWKCNQGLAFTIDFGWDTPFEKEQYRAPPNPGGVSTITEKQVKVDGAKSGRRMKFKYTIAALDPASGTIYINDPEIIIDP